MRILCDKPTQLKEALNDDTISIDYSPALDIYTKNNALLTTLKGLYVSSKLDFEDQDLISYIKEKAKPAVEIEPVCHTCYTYEEFDTFCKKYLDSETELKVAYDVETTAAPFLSKHYKLAGFSLANTVKEGCYVVLQSIDYKNPDIDKCIERLSNIIKTHNMLVFNAQHEYIATKICVNNTNLATESKHLDDAYAMALTMKTESFKADVFKLKLLCHRLLGTENWASIVDDYIELAQDIGSDDTYDFSCLDEKQQDKFDAFCEMLIYGYDYTSADCKKFITILQKSYPVWRSYGTLPYTLIPSRMIMKYGCYDACYLVELFNFFESWAKELEDKLKNAINKPNIKLSYEECVASQIMSGILTINGIAISEERDEEVRQKAVVEANKYYDRLWEVNSDVTGKNILREYVIHDSKQRAELEKKYLLPKHLLQLIPDGFEFISTTPTFYSFLCRKKTDDLDMWIESEGLKPANKNKPDEYKLVAKHLKPFSVLDNEDKLLEDVLDEYFKDKVEKDGSLQKNVFKPMSGPDALFDILTRELNYSHFLARVILYEYENIPEKDKDLMTSNFLEENPLFKFDEDTDSYLTVAKRIKTKVLNYLQKSYPFKDTWENLVENGIHSFASPIISYIHNIYTATGCTVEEPKYAAFDFICRLKICRKYLRIFATFVAGSSGGYEVQKFIDNDSIYNEHLTTLDLPVAINKQLQPKPENSQRVVFGSWYANCADTGRWRAQVHNVPAGPFCKRRFVSRFPGGFILANDMSQAEIRELAAVSKCEGLLKVVKDPNIDVHKMTASLAFDVPYDEVTSTQRKQIKTGVFSIVYGRDEQSLAQELFKGDHKAAKRLMDSIFKVYPEISEYLEEARADVKKYGYLVTRRGLPIYVNPYTQENKDKGEAGTMRMAQNYSIQGGSAQFCTGTLVNVQKLLNKYKLKSKIICYIHDSIEIDVHPEEFDAVFVILNSAFNKIATEKYGLPTASDTVLGVSMGEELDIKRLDKWHYKLEGNAPDIEDVLNQFKFNYNIEIVSDELDEIKDQTNSTDWCFIQRSELRWLDKKQNRKTEIKLTLKN